MNRLFLTCLLFSVSIVSCRNDNDNDDDDEQAEIYDVDCNMVNPDDETSCLAHLCAAQAVYRACEGPATYCYRREACYEEFYIEFTWYCPVDGNLQPDLQSNYDEVDAEYQTCLADAEDDGVADSDDPIVPYNGPDPYAEVDCEVAGQDENMCDYIVCTQQQGAISSMYSCRATVENCEASWQCILDYLHCLVVSCPSGEEIEYMNTSVRSACEEAINMCIGAL